MDLRHAAQYIRDSVSMNTIIRLYGYEARHGNMVCPFHSEKTASLKVYPGNRGWHCFGCGRGGSVIDFVMEHDGCDFRTAVKAIDEALGLHLIGHDDPFTESRRRDLDAILDEMAELLVKAIDDKEKQIEITLRIGTRKSMEIECKRNRERTAEEITELDNLYEGMRYDEYRKEQLDGLREEVRTWRREKRRRTGNRKAR